MQAEYINHHHWFPRCEAVQELLEVETLVPHKAILLYKVCIHSLIMLLWDIKLLFIQILGGTAPKGIHFDKVSTSKNLKFLHSLCR